MKKKMKHQDHETLVLNFCYDLLAKSNRVMGYYEICNYIELTFTEDKYDYPTSYSCQRAFEMMCEHHPFIHVDIGSIYEDEHLFGLSAWDYEFVQKSILDNKIKQTKKHYEDLVLSKIRLYGNNQQN